MSKVDQFESRLRGAAKQLYRHTPRAVDHVLVFTDLQPEQTNHYGSQVQRALDILPASEARSWRFVPGPECYTIGDVLALVERHQPDLVCAYRNLHSGAWRWPYSLSDHIEVLTQATDVPVLLLPRPSAPESWAAPDVDVANYCVMALTDHLAGDDSLVDHAVAFTPPGGRLVLSHVEDDGTFERYMEVMGRIPEIDTDMARERVLHQLLREPADYIESAMKELRERGIPLTVEALVTKGHRLGTYRELVDQRGVDLLVLRSKDEDQLAMHGMSYPLAVELRDLPLLLL